MKDFGLARQKITKRRQKAANLNVSHLFDEDYSMANFCIENDEPPESLIEMAGSWKGMKVS